MAQITSIVSEALQRQVRTLLPSQEGFTEDLQAQNVIVPVIDLTPTAEGSTLPSYLQTALTLSDATVFSFSNSATTIANTPGFWQVNVNISTRALTSSDNIANLNVTDGTTTKTLVGITTDSVSTGDITNTYIVVVICLSAGESITISSSEDTCFVRGSARQLATLDGTLINPTGFAPQ